VKILHFNIAGGVVHRGSNGIADRLTCLALLEHRFEFGVANPGPPDLISVNEICEPQYERLERQLGEAGYRGFFHSGRGKFFSSCGLGVAEGTAILSRRGVVPGSARGYTVSSAAEEAETNERRVAACLTTANAPRIRACSTHLYKGPRIAAPQLRRLIGMVRTGDPLVLAGDLNLEPDHPAVVEAHKTFDDIDMTDPRPCRPPKRPDFPGGPCTFPGTGKKIDYILLDREHFRPDYVGRVFPAGECRFGPPPAGTQTPPQRAGPCSDHHQLWGTAALGRVDFRSFARRWTGPGFSVTVEAKGRVRIATTSGRWAVAQLLDHLGRDGIRGHLVYSTDPRFKADTGFWMRHYRYGSVATDLGGWRFLCGPDTARLAPPRDTQFPC
jgi:endonuclease/exonuclease/phosphatase family metal-dependent hydrolase